MKTRPHIRSAQRGALATEAIVAIALLTAAVFPLAYSFHHEHLLLRAGYHRAIALELVDGEMEILAAGEWRAFAPGEQAYAVRAPAATNLPPGEFRLAIHTNLVRLQWLPKDKHAGGPVTREALVK